MASTAPSPLWPRKRGELLAKFCDEEFEFEAEWAPRGTQAHLLVRLLDLYESRGLAYRPGRVALCDICRHARGCWRDMASSTKRRPTRVWYRENGGIVLPWVGRDYDIGGVVVIGINPNIGADDYTFLLIEHGISWRHYVETFERNRLTEDHSSFGGSAMRTAGLVLDELDGQAITDRHDNPKDLIDVVHRTARLQAVKCIPKQTKSEPSDQMIRRCPEFLLADELAILRPSRIVALGAPARDAICQMSNYRPLRSRAPHLQFGEITSAGRKATVYMLSHPNARGGEWAKGLASLKRHLAR